MTAPLLRVAHLEVHYGDLIGVADVSFDVPEGSVVALLGSNGGGKTTTLNAIAGLIPVRSGHIAFRGQEISGQDAFAIVRKGLALSPEGWRLFVQQSVENNLLLGSTPLRDKARAATLLERVYEIFPRLKERRNQRAGTMSGGERRSSKQKVVLHALLHEQPPAFRRQRESLAHDRKGALAADLLALEGDRSCMQRDQARDRIQGRGLAAAIGAEQRDNGALGNLEGDVGHPNQVAIANLQVLDLEQRTAHSTGPPISSIGVWPAAAFAARVPR